MWILEHFPPTKCKADILHMIRPTKNATTGRLNCYNYKNWAADEDEWLAFEDEKATCDYPETFTDPVDNEEKTCEEVPVKEGWGIANSHFMAWVRISGLMRFEKLYARVPTDTIKGQTITIKVKNAFPVDSYHASKEIVFRTSVWTGVDQTSLGTLLLILGLVGLAVSMFFFTLTCLRPHGIANITVKDWGSSQGFTKNYEAKTAPAGKDGGANGGGNI